jgi:hypothetical protein
MPIVTEFNGNYDAKHNRCGFAASSIVCRDATCLMITWLRWLVSQSCLVSCSPCAHAYTKTFTTCCSVATCLIFPTQYMYVLPVIKESIKYTSTSIQNYRNVTQSERKFALQCFCIHCGEVFCHPLLLRLYISSGADPGEGLWPLACLDCGFESRWWAWKFISCECCVLPTQLPIKWVTALFRESKAVWEWRWPPTPI